MKLDISRLARDQADELARAFRERHLDVQEEIEIAERVLAAARLRLNKAMVSAELQKFSDVVRDQTIEISKATHRQLVQLSAVLAPGEPPARVLMALLALARAEELR